MRPDRTRPDLTWSGYTAALDRHDLEPAGPEAVRDRLTGLVWDASRHRRRLHALAGAVVWASLHRSRRGIAPAPTLPPPRIRSLAHAS